MSAYVVYEKHTGRIIRAGQCQDGLESRMAVGPLEAAIAGAGDPTVHYVDLKTGAVREREPIAVQVTGTTVSNLPAGGCTLTIDGTSYRVDGTVARLNFNLPGTYRVRVTSSTFRDTDIVVTV
jgi:hypothetical protein